MTGPEHYEEAARLSTYLGLKITEAEVGTDTVVAAAERIVATVAPLAQIHATLALAAATAYPAVRDYCGDEGTDSRAWTQATS